MVLSPSSASARERPAGHDLGGNRCGREPGQGDCLLRVVAGLIGLVVVVSHRPIRGQAACVDDLIA
jgi:hypothetical protein